MLKMYRFTNLFHHGLLICSGLSLQITGMFIGFSSSFAFFLIFRKYTALQRLSDTVTGTTAKLINQLIT